MKLINLILLALLVGFSAFSQDDMERASEVTITKSEAYPVVDASLKIYFKNSNNEVLAIKRIKQGYLFQIFEGQQLNLKKSLIEAFDFKSSVFYGIHELNSDLVLMYSVFDKVSNSESLYAQVINREEGGFDGKTKLLLTVEKEISSFGFTRQSHGMFSFDFSADKKILAVKYRYKPEIKDDSRNHDIFGMHVFDDELNEMWKADLTMPYTESLMDNFDFSVDSKGKGYFLIKKYKEENNRKNHEIADNQSLAILIADADGSLNEVEFNLGEYMIAGVYMKENKEGNIICAGYYRKPKSRGIDGTFVSIMDREGNLNSLKFYEFSLDFIKKYKRISERGKRKMEREEEEGKLAINFLTMRNIELLEDGGIVLAGEIYYVTSTTDPKTGHTTYTYHYDDVILVKINANGELGWMQKFPKISIRESFRIMVSEKYTYILFLDPVRNATMTDQGEVDRSIKGDYVTAHRVDNKTGDAKYLHLFDLKKIDGIPVYQYSLNRVIVLTDNSFAIEMYIKQKSDMMFKVTFEE